MGKGSISELAIIGYGRFGRAFGALAAAAGIRIKAFDPAAAAAEPGVSQDFGEALAGAELVVFAVPVEALDAALERARPLLGPGQIVIDVGSVKCHPVASMARHCGAEIPWVATHPLFGPDSLALGERPLGVVVCPNADHPEASERVGRFYRRLGCEVREQGPEEHDELMAETHALAFFIASALVDMGVDKRAEAAPPSFRALARTIESVRADAGHLMGTIQRDNPFAPSARRRLIEALGALDAKLNSASAPVALAPGASDPFPGGAVAPSAPAVPAETSATAASSAGREDPSPRG